MEVYRGKSLTSTNNVLVELDNMVACLNKKPPLDLCADRLKVLLALITDALTEIEELLHRPEMKKCISRIKLCSSQISKTLPALVTEIFHNKNKNTDVVMILIEKLHCCMNEIVVMTNEDPPLDDKTDENFVHSMDMAIGLLNSDKHTDEGYRLLVEDLLCQGLTIAKLSCPQDYNEITSGCRNVLSALSTLLDDEKSVVSVYKDYLLSALESLERRVNIAVLRLALHSFSEPFVILKGLVKKCREKQPSSERSSSDLDEMVSCFDLFCDRIHLVGNFAVACSENKKVILAVQSSLASLEFCEKYLVLAITDFYLNQTNVQKRSYLKFIVDSWHSELLTLSSLLDNIIDTSAFIQVAQDDLQGYIDKIKCVLNDGEGAQEAINVFVKRGKKIVEHTNRSIEEEIRNSSFVINVLNSLSSGLKDLSSGLKCVVHTNETTLMQKLEIIVSHLEKLSNYLNQFSFMNSLHKLSFVSSSSKYPDSVQDLPFDVSNTSNEDSSAVKGMEWLKSRFLLDEEPELNDCALAPYFSRALEKSVLRSTFYNKTPNRSIKVRNQEMYNVSDILENLTGLDHTFDGAGLLSSEGTLDTKKESFSNSKRNISDVELISTLVSDISKINSLERIEDINRVEDKLKKLKSKN